MGGLRRIASRWDRTLPEDTLELAKAESPDGLVHAGLSTDHLTLCERMNDTWLGGDKMYVRLNLDLPGASAERHRVDCPECKEVMHS